VGARYAAPVAACAHCLLFTCPGIFQRGGAQYGKLTKLARWVNRLLVHAAEGPRDPGWTNYVADPLADARSVLRLYANVGSGAHFPWLLRRAVMADRARVQALLHAWDAGAAPTAAEYRELTLIALRLQAAVWHPAGWWFALWQLAEPLPPRTARRIALDATLADTIA